MNIIGVDPGPTTGICVLRSQENPSFYQCDAGSAYDLVAWLMARSSTWTELRGVMGVMTSGIPVLLAGEAFQAGRGAGARQGTGKITRDLIAMLGRMGNWHWRAAGLVKPWATDERLKKAGLYCTGMGHATDAARHALYCAVHDAGWPDPLSKARASAPLSGPS